MTPAQWSLWMVEILKMLPKNITSTILENQKIHLF